MSKLGKYKTYIINQIMNTYPFGFLEASRIVKIMQDEGIISRKIASEADADLMINNEIRNYLQPKGLIRFKKYTLDELQKIGIILQFVREKNDEWGTKIYFDKINGLLWEDAPGRYSNEGFQISSEQKC